MRTTAPLFFALRTLAPLSFVIAAVILTGNPIPARAEPVPQPREALRDYQGTGVIQVDVPGSSDPAADPGLALWIPFRQSYVAPDRVLQEMIILGQPQATLAMGATERTWSPLANYIVNRTYKNLDPGAESPMTAMRLAMASFGRVVRELTTGKLLPEEDPARLKETLTARMTELAELRKKLAGSVTAEDVKARNRAAAEHARLADDLKQLAIRKNHPCHVVEFQNRDLGPSFLARGLMGPSSVEILSRGITRVWLTRAEGLPIKVETTAGDGRVALFICFTELKINAGLKPSDLVLGAPPLTRQISAVADLREKNWEEKLERYLGDQIARLEQERQKQQQNVRRPAR